MDGWMDVDGVVGGCTPMYVWTVVCWKGPIRLLEGGYIHIHNPTCNDVKPCSPSMDRRRFAPKSNSRREVRPSSPVLD